MSIALPDGCRRYLLDRMVKGTNVANNWTLKLYTAVAGGIVAGTVVGDITEATFTGYSAKTLAPATWGAAATATGTTSTTYGSAQTFTRSSTGTNEAVLGYYIVDATTGALVAIEAFAATRNFVNAGDADTFTPKIELSVI